MRFAVNHFDCGKRIADALQWMKLSRALLLQATGTWSDENPDMVGLD